MATSQVSARNRSLRKHRLAGRRQLLEALGEVHGVADERVLEALLRTEQGRGRLAGRKPEPEPERRQAFLNPALVDLSLTGVHGGGGGDRTVRMVVWETGAPKTAMTASPTNCITVPPSPRIALFIAARCVLSWPASWLGSACSAMVE